MIFQNVQVRVPTYSYVGAGNSTSKKDAQANAAKDFLMFLVRTGELNSKDCPALDVSTILILHSWSGPWELGVLHPPGKFSQHLEFFMNKFVFFKCAENGSVILMRPFPPPPPPPPPPPRLSADEHHPCLVVRTFLLFYWGGGGACRYPQSRVKKSFPCSCLWCTFPLP